MTHHSLTAIRNNEIGGRDQKRLEFRFDRLVDQPTRARTQDFGERIVDFIFLSEGYNSMLVQGTRAVPRAGCWGYGIYTYCL
jgi:hypothetical protein